MLLFPMRFLLCKTDRIGDLVAAMPVQKCILDNEPSAEVFWMVRPDTAPILDHVPGIAGVLHRLPDSNLEQLIKYIKPDALLNISHLDREIIPAAKKAGVPIRVARPRGLKQIFCATHIIWAGRTGSGRHASQHAMDFLKQIGWPVQDSIPPPPQLVLTPEEIERGMADLQHIPAPRLGAITRGSGGGAFPSHDWWARMLGASKTAGWNPIVLTPPDECCLPPTNIRGLMARLRSCDAVIGISTGPVHLSAALNVPTLCLMGRRIKHGPDRWAPMGSQVETLQYPGEEDDLGDGMDRLSLDDVLARLKKLRSDC